MADWAWCSLALGGRVLRSNQAALEQLIAEQGWETDLTEDGVRHLGGLTRYGWPDPEFTAKLRALGVSYRFHAESTAENDCALNYWHPGIEVDPNLKPSDGEPVISHPANKDEEPVASLPRLKAELEAGRTLADVIASMEHYANDPPPLEFVDEPVEATP